MKIDITNKWQMLLVGGADLSDGCSVIRNILLRSIFGICIAASAAVVAVVIGFILGGVILYLFSPWYGQLNVGLSLSWLGNSWWAEGLRTGAATGLVTVLVCSVVCFLVLMVRFFNGSIWRKSKWRAVEAITNSPPARAIKSIYEAAYNIAHKICPKVELIFPPEVQYLVENRETVRISLPDSGMKNGVITDIIFNPHDITIWMKGHNHSTYCYWHLGRKCWNEEVIVTSVDESPTPE